MYTFLTVVAVMFFAWGLFLVMCLFNPIILLGRPTDSATHKAFYWSIELIGQKPHYILLYFVVHCDLIRFIDGKWSFVEIIYDFFWGL